MILSDCDVPAITKRWRPFVNHGELVRARCALCFTVDARLGSTCAEAHRRRSGHVVHCYEKVELAEFFSRKFFPILRRFRLEALLLKPTWEYVSSKYLPKTHITLYRDNVLNVQMQIETRRSQLSNPEKAKFYYFIDGEKKIYTSEQALMAALQKKLMKEDKVRYAQILQLSRNE
jgi:hypothetical protein